MWTRLPACTAHLPDRYVMVQHPGGADRGGGEWRRRQPPYRGCRPAGPAVARDQQQDHRDQFQSLLDRAGVDRAARSHSADAERPGYLDQRAHPHLRHASATNCTPSQINWYSEDAVNYRVQAGPRRASIRSARSASISRARTASICTTRRRRTCSATTCASTPPAACGCRTCANWSTGCCATRPAGRARRSTR